MYIMAAHIRYVAVVEEVDKHTGYLDRILAVVDDQRPACHSFGS